MVGEAATQSKAVSSSCGIYFLLPEEIAWGSSGKEARILKKYRRLLARMKESDRQLLLHMAQKMARR